MNDTATIDTPTAPAADPEPAAPAVVTRPRRSYSDVDRLAALAALDANGGIVKRTARQLGIPVKTLEGWAKGRHGAVTPEQRAAARKDLQTALEDFALRLVGMDPRSFEGLSFKDLCVGLGITIDKILLLRGLPTAISRTQTAAGPDLSRMNDAELTAYVEKLRAEAASAADKYHDDNPTDDAPAEPEDGPPAGPGGGGVGAAEAAPGGGAG
jgi:transposase-like protein